MWLLLLAILSQSIDASYSCHKLNQGGYKELGAPLIKDINCKKIVIAKSLLFTPLLVFNDKQDKYWKIFLISGGGIGISLTIALDK